MLSSTIMLQFRKNQDPFTLRLSSVTVDTAENMNLGFFINSDTITADSRATLGKGQSCYFVVCWRPKTSCQLKTAYSCAILCV